jgi:hypothetical protein
MTMGQIADIHKLLDGFTVSDAHIRAFDRQVHQGADVIRVRFSPDTGGAQIDGSKIAGRIVGGTHLFFGFRLASAIGIRGRFRIRPLFIDIHQRSVSDHSIQRAGVDKRRCAAGTGGINGVPDTFDVDIEHDSGRMGPPIHQ